MDCVGACHSDSNHSASGIHVCYSRSGEPQVGTVNLTDGGGDLEKFLVFSGIRIVLSTGDSCLFGVGKRAGRKSRCRRALKVVLAGSTRLGVPTRLRMTRNTRLGICTNSCLRYLSVRLTGISVIVSSSLIRADVFGLNVAASGPTLAKTDALAVGKRGNTLRYAELEGRCPSASSGVCFSVPRRNFGDTPVCRSPGVVDRGTARGTLLKGKGGGVSPKLLRVRIIFPYTCVKQDNGIGRRGLMSDCKKVTASGFTFTGLRGKALGKGGGS